MEGNGGSEVFGSHSQAFLYLHQQHLLRKHLFYEDDCTGRTITEGVGVEFNGEALARTWDPSPPPEKQKLKASNPGDLSGTS